MLVLSCAKDTSTNPQSYVFSATLGSDTFVSNDVTLLSAGGTAGLIAKDDKGRSFSVAVFPKDFPLGKAVGVAYSPSIAYNDGKNSFIAKSGSMTFSALEAGKTMTATFTFVGTSSGTDINIEGKFDVKK